MIDTLKITNNEPLDLKLDEGWNAYKSRLKSDQTLTIFKYGYNGPNTDTQFNQTTFIKCMNSIKNFIRKNEKIGNNITLSYTYTGTNSTTNSDAKSDDFYRRMNEAEFILKYNLPDSG